MSAIAIETMNNMFRTVSRDANKTASKTSGNEIGLIPTEYHWVVITFFPFSLRSYVL